MSGPLADGNVGSQLNSNCSDHESSTISAFRKAEVELMVIRTIHRVIEPVIEPLIRRVVKEEIELVQERILTSMKQRNSGNTIHPSEPKGLELRFLNKLSLRVLTGRYIEGEDGTSVKVGLFDAKGEEVKFGPEASAEVEILVLRDDQSGDEGRDITTEEFNLKIEKKRKGNRSLLTGKTFLKLKEGIGLVDKINFTHISDWMSKRSFRLGARIVDNFNGTTVREAKSEPFTLEDCRNELSKKHDPPSPSDKVWRLKNIAKRGPRAKRLMDGNIRTVKEFLTEYSENPQRLRDILGTGMSDNMFDDTVEHARTCLHSSSRLPNALSPPNSLRLQGHSGLDVGTSHVIDGISSNNTVGTSPRIAACDPTLPSTSSPRILPSNNSIGTSPRIAACDPTQPSTSSPGILPSNNSIGTSQMTTGYDHTWLGTSSPGIFSSRNSSGRISSMAGALGQVPNHQMFEPINGFINIDGMEFPYEPSGALGQVPNHQMFDLMSLIQDFELDEQLRFLSNNCNLQADLMSLIQDFEMDEQLRFLSNNCNLQAMNPRVESPADGQTAENGRRRRWSTVHIVLKFSDHVRKKQRVK